MRNASAAHPFPGYHPQEVLNARLFTRLRDELGLVYTASVRFGPDAPAGGGGDDSSGGGGGDGGSSCTLSLVAAPPDAARARREAAALLRRLSSVSGGGGGGSGSSGGGGGVFGASRALAVTPEPISRLELRAARRRLLARLEQSGRGRQTDRAGRGRRTAERALRRRRRTLGSLTVDDLHGVFSRVDTAAMVAPEKSGMVRAYVPEPV